MASFDELNTLLLAHCQRDDVRIVHGQTMSIGQAWRAEQTSFHPLPARPFACCVTRQVTLSPYSQVTYETNRYSVPVEKARRELSVKAYPFRIEIVQGAEVLASHPRCYGHAQDIFDPLHYLALLEQRPGAFAYARPLKRWRQQWPVCYHQLLTLLQEKWPQGRGVQEFVRVLKLHQEYAAGLIEQAVKLALDYGCVHFDGVSHCLQQLAHPTVAVPLLDLSEKPHLAHVGTQAVDLHAYEQLVERLG